MNWAVIRDPTLLVTAVVYGVLSALAIGIGIFGLFGLWLGVLLFISLWRYSYAVLRAVAQGHRRIPAPDVDSFNPIGEWSVFFHFISFPGLLVATQPYQPLGTLIAVASACVFPASAAVMALTSSLSAAFRPAALGAFIRAVGSDYTALVIGNFALFTGALLLVRYVVPSFGLLSLVLGFTLEIWALLAAFALIGSVLRAHRLEFHIHGELRPPEEIDRDRRYREWTRELDLAYASFRSGLDFAGYQTLHAFVDANANSLEVNHWLVDHMLDWHDHRYALEIAIGLLPRLLDSGDAAGALELYQKCRRRAGAVSLPAALADRLAEQAAAFGRTGLVDELSYNRKSL